MAPRSRSDVLSVPSAHWRLLAAPRRRHVLAVLGAERRASIEALAEAIVAREAAGGPVAETGEDVDAVIADLAHVHLPALSTADAVEYDRDDRTVALSDRSLADSPLAATDGRGDGLTRRVCVAMADERRQTILAVLADRSAPTSPDDLALAVCAREGDCSLSEVDEAVHERVHVALHHRYVPELAAADLVERDDAGAVSLVADLPSLVASTVADRAGLDPGTLADGPLAQSPLAGAFGSDDVWTVTGREDVIERGQSLFDAAEDELFVMITTDGLLNDQCLEKLNAAIDRGVDAYVGSQTTAVRDLVREEAPEAVIWEPQLDWLALPPQRERLGRLVMADREAVMLGTLGEETRDGVPAETAVTGEGRDNTLVVLLRELLGSRLDHLDRQSPDFRSQIPL